jgi:hypothetical protein
MSGNKGADGDATRAAWDVIKAEYLAGGISYRKLAVKHGVPRRTLEDRALAERWSELRGQVRGKIAAELPAVVAEQVLVNAQVWVEEVIRIASQMMRELEDRLDGTQKVIVTTQGERVLMELPWLNKAQDLKAAVSALAELDRVGRLSLGLDKGGEEAELDQDWDAAMQEIELLAQKADETIG